MEEQRLTPPPLDTCPTRHGTAISSDKMTSKFTVKATNLARTKLSITGGNREYEAHLSYLINDIQSNRKQNSVVLSSKPQASKPSTKSWVIGAGDINLLSLENPLRICFGDPNLRNADPKLQWQIMPCRQQASIDAYEITFDHGSGGDTRVYHWKRTHTGDGIGPVAKKLDFLNLKLQNQKTGEVVARFVHHPWCGWKRGYFEVRTQDPSEGDRWIEAVILSGLTVLEYQRKITGFSL